ncbi:hypothetical protein ABT336_11940 [Micromonospora sp. NPDC000207]|uniref:hypothetical protein n=1 Tax=Micromonospora sp. NPDC000207 TaxID=3154246 RepID=UPI0033170565
MEPPDGHPVHRVEVDDARGPTIELQARTPDLAESPAVDLTFSVDLASDGEVSVSCRYGLSVDEVDELIAALQRARAEAAGG